LTASTPEPGASTGLSDDIVAWVEKCAEGRVVHADRRPGGGRREAWVVDVEGADGVRPLFLRYDRSDPAVTGDPFTLHREARFYLALQDSPVPVPRVLGVHDTDQAILSERVGGETWFSRLRDEQQRLTVARDFMRILASLHRLDPSVLTIPGEQQPADLREAVTSDLDRWEALYRFDGAPDDAMIEFGLDWLRHNQPAVDGPVVIVQGDTGPGNFLYDDGHVTAVLDWELGHWGDPMDDLGWLALRAVQEPFTSLPDRLRDWEEHTGWSVDLDRVRYYRVLAELKVVILGHRRAEGQNLLGEVGNGLIYGQLHRRLFVEAMADVLGVELEVPDDMDAPATEAGWLYDAAMAQIREIIVPRSTDPFVVLRAKGLARILKHLQQVDRLGATVRADELADLRALTGAAVASVEDGRARLATAVRAGRVSTADALRYFTRRAARGTQLLRPAMGVLADRHFDPLT
jgi:aminoglycoside phosphotransferase (APT) family kinase protein